MMSEKIAIDFGKLIQQVKGKEKVDVKTHYRKSNGTLTRVDHYTKYIEKHKEDVEPEIEDLDPDLLTVDEPEEDYADTDVFIDEGLTPSEEAILPPKEVLKDISVSIKAWKTKRDEEALKLIIEKYNNILYFHANKYKTSPIPYNLILLECKRLLIKALDTFDPGKKAAFNTHLTNYLKKLYRFVGENQNIAKIPEQRIRKINDYNTTLAKLEDRFGRVPTEAEMADELSWSIREVGRLRNELGRAEILQYGEDYSFSDLGVVSNKTPEAIKLVYFDASPEGKFVIEHTYGISGKKQFTTKEIAKKLKISEAKAKYIISDIRSKIIENM